MPSLIQAYEYDIFISYRHKDNKNDGWVTTFVEDLRKEMESTFKDEVSIYFDANPHDGLHENYDVDDSLKEKIRCAVFIPIISRTYCDPKSFAWRKEFLAFRDFATADPRGLKVKVAWEGDVKKTFRWLDLAYKYRDPGLSEMKASPIIKPLQHDPRYRAMLEKLKLPL